MQSFIHSTRVSLHHSYLKKKHTRDFTSWWNLCEENSRTIWSLVVSCFMHLFYFGNILTSALLDVSDTFRPTIQRRKTTEGLLIQSIINQRRVDRRVFGKFMSERQRNQETFGCFRIRIPLFVKQSGTFLCHSSQRTVILKYTRIMVKTYWCIRAETDSRRPHVWFYLVKSQIFSFVGIFVVFLTSLW